MLRFFPLLWQPIRGLRQGAGGKRLAQPAPLHLPLSCLSLSPPAETACFSVSFALFALSTGARLRTRHPCWRHAAFLYLTLLPVLAKWQTVDRVASEREACGHTGTSLGLTPGRAAAVRGHATSCRKETHTEAQTALPCPHPPPLPLFNICIYSNKISVLT